MIARALVTVAIALTWTGVGCRARSSPSTHHAGPQADGPGSEPPRSTGGPARKPQPAAPPVTAEACRACQGLWAVHGLDDKPSCNCRTTDAGKRCRDGADCQGMCVARTESPEVEVVNPGPPARGFFVGRCSELVTVFGCNRILERGASAHGPVPVAEPPPTICVD